MTSNHDLDSLKKAVTDADDAADVNARNNDGETPLFTTDDIESIPLLLRHGADPNLRNKDGKTALEATEKNQPKHEALLTAIRARASSQ